MKLMRKLIVIFMLLVSFLSANGYKVTYDFTNITKHYIEVPLFQEDWNEDNKWKSIGIHKLVYDDLWVGLEYSEFVNSFYDDTKFFTLTNTYTPFSIGDLNIGGQLSIGGQEGYQTNGVFFNKCIATESCRGFIVIPSFYMEYKYFYMGLSGMPETLFVGRFGVQYKY